MGLIQCPRCGKEVDGASQFCKRCGANIKSDAAAVAVGVLPQPATGNAAFASDALPLEFGNQPAMSRFRWVVLTLVFLAITINYVDRMVLGILAPSLRTQFKINDQDYGYITAAFGLFYALGQLVSGGLLDRIGTRAGYAIALAAWSAASMLHAAVRSAFGFAAARALLGVTESPAYPAATKTLSEWFPKKERALAMGFVNAGSNVGAVVAPIMVPWLAINFGWQSAFIVTGALGLLWLAAWIPIYRRPEKHSWVSASELAHINSDPPEPTGRIPWVTLLSFKQAWGFALGKFLTDPIWSFYLFWLPTFLHDKHGVQLSGVAAPLIVVYVMADFGSIIGGWISSTMIKRGFSVNAARKTAMLISAACIVPSAFTSMITGMWPAVFVMGMAVAGHQGFSSNLYTLVSDTFPRRAVGSVSGIGGTFGYLGYTLFGVLVGWILTVTHKNYLPIFLMCASAYLIAFAAIHLLMPKLAPVAIPEDRQRGFGVVPPPPPGGIG